LIEDCRTDLLILKIKYITTKTTTVTFITNKLTTLIFLNNKLEINNVPNEKILEKNDFIEVIALIFSFDRILLK